ncbi:MAG: hypothetical protein ACRC28_18805 [Clostridium sp.]|uniref:hypothetical protein n=1 Tax=Clostridium sp. TaxID=1506 RepID=UPI003F2CDED2
MKKEFKKKELSGVIGVAPITIKKWSEERIKEEMKKNCWVINNIRKQGRSLIFECEYQEYSIPKKEYVQAEFNVKDPDKFTKYSKKRFDCEEGKFKTRKQICSEVQITPRTSINWDDKLVEKGIMDKDGFIYVKTNRETGERQFVTKDNYSNFWRENKVASIKLNALAIAVAQKKIKLDDYCNEKENVLDKANLEFYYSKHTKFVINKGNSLYTLLLDTLEELENKQ